ncbi:outer membrane lipoprotein-sorting protein [Aggregicoccus sp. 17bor-14]|uniref:outer membrane lipoprotein-sorting protein n=1 Tax=Myxococcaceae TaxID=31 RepID=UPI00129C36BD|nr:MULTISPECIES: outer membrane lipoprotein-sorting protein [Myxococcaceae]MBF5044868.1 outer membrane lipoprotein-sorting protein [Simulacricoccus sp. 17bor-14]MRI90612.1 outer membrane lipoprotein-sorting protein [Aggregicoccus sp. 17bor-14]
MRSYGNALKTPKLPLLAAVMAVCLLAPLAAHALDDAQMLQLLKTIDDRQRNSGDYRSLVYLEQKEKDKLDTAREALVFRRDADDKLMILFTKPKGESGKGYLRLDKNLWSYDPNVGKWERRTERERIAGTDSRRADFDESRLAEEYTPKFEGDGTLGKFKVHMLTLSAKPGIDVAYPVVKLWVDADTSNVLKRQEFALSGRLLRTAYYPKWQKLYSESKKADVWYPQEMRFFDEVEKANSTIVLIKTVDLRPLEANIFTKAWLESKSR